MSRLNKLFIALVAVSALALFGATPALADADEPVFAGGVTSGDDTDVMFLIKCTGPGCTGTCTVAAATSVLSFVAAGANDTTVDASGVCGANTYQLDATDADCDTVGELIDMINASANWSAVPLDSVRTDTVNAKLLDKSATSAITAGGLAFYWDTSAILHSTRALVPFAARKIEFYLNNSVLKPDPFKGYQFRLRYTTSTASTCTAAGTYSFVQVKATNSGTAGAEVADTLFSAAASGTSAVTYDWSNTPIVSDADRKVVVRRSCGTGYVNTQLVVLGTSE